jgi:hypothetical protein
MEQLDLFTDYTALKAQQEAEDAALERERQIQETMLTIKRRFGKKCYSQRYESGERRDHHGTKPSGGRPPGVEGGLLYGQRL